MTAVAEVSNVYDIVFSLQLCRKLAGAAPQDIKRGLASPVR
jgi:hypothetical protein